MSQPHIHIFLRIKPSQVAFHYRHFALLWHASLGFLAKDEVPHRLESALTCAFIVLYHKCRRLFVLERSIAIVGRIEHTFQSFTFRQRPERLAVHKGIYSNGNSHNDANNCYQHLLHFYYI